jgi:uracil-DNA glycosylase family 4
MSEMILPGSFDELFGDMGVTTIKFQAAKYEGCEACGRLSDCKTPKFPIYGQGGKGILIVSEVPGPTDDEDGIPLSGSAGLLLRKELRTHGIDLKRDCWVVFAVRCHGPKPTGAQVSNCRGFTTRDIGQLKPRIIIPCGIIAIQAVLDDRTRGRMTGTKPTAFIGCRIPDQEYGAWVCPVEGLNYLVEKTPYGKPKNEDSVRLWQRDIEKAVNVPEFPVAPNDNIALVYTTEDATSVIKAVHREARITGSEVGFDFEATGLKPHAQGHRIVCTSLAVNDKAFAFPMFEDAGFHRALEALLTDEDVGKVAHNAQFEAMWTKQILGYWPDGWAADTCLDAHVINNTKPTSLKFEVYTRLGIAGYDANADQYLKADGEGCNAINNIHKAPMPMLLEYCAKDSLYMMRVRELQIQDLKEYRPQIKAGQLFLEASMELARCSMHGMHIDMTLVDQAAKDLTVQIAEAYERAYACEEVKAMGPNFSLTSNQDLARLVYDKLGFKGTSRTVDKNTLKEVDAPFVEHLLTARELGKLKDTYLEQYQREQVGGILRPNFPLNRVTSYRGSHADPNVGNVPKRNKIATKILRSAFKPSPGNVLIEVDYSQLEGVIGAVYHEDPTMTKYLLDPSVNLHSDNACDLWLRDRAFLDAGSPAAKAERNAAKQLWFASSYGSNYIQTHVTAWKNVGEETKAHLASKGIKTIADFKEHVKKFDGILWEKRFPVYAAWKQNTYQNYKVRGYVEHKTGFRCWGPLKYTEAINLATQGSAFYCLLWTLRHTAPLIRGLSGRSNLVAHIHDALVLDAHPSEVAEIIRLIREYGTKKVREALGWVSLPLNMEAEVSDVDGSWAVMHHYTTPESA